MPRLVVRSYVDMKEDNKPIKDDDEMRPEYDLSKLKLVGRGIYAERFRRGTNLAQLIKRDRQANEKQADIDDIRPEYEASGEISAKSDLYSAGKILWSAVTGRKAFAREEPIWGAMSMKSIFPDRPNTWHLGPILEKTIQEKEYDRPLPYEAMELSKKISSVIGAGFPPIELIGKQCPVCGFGELSTETGWVAWGKAAPAGTAYFECDHCGFYFAQNKTRHEQSVKGGKPTTHWRGF